MKKYSILFFLVVICLFITGCKGNTTRGIRHAGFNLSSTEFKCSGLLPTSKDAIYYDKIKFLGDSFAITEEGGIYELSFSQPYSNKENCKMINLREKIVAIMDNSIGKASDGKFYYLTSNNNSRYAEVTYSDSSYEIYSILLNEENVLKVITLSQNDGIYYALKNDGNIYKIIISRSDYNQPYQLVSREVIYSRENFGEIIDFNYGSTASTTNYIRTRDSLYRTKILNVEECKKYIDIECKYELQLDTDLMEFLDSVLAYNGTTLLTNYGKYFTAA